MKIMGGQKIRYHKKNENLLKLKISFGECDNQNWDKTKLKKRLNEMPLRFRISIASSAVRLDRVDPGIPEGVSSSI